MQHIKNQPKHRYGIYERNVDWMDYWLNGRRDERASKHEQYERWDALRAGLAAGR